MHHQQILTRLQIKLKLTVHLLLLYQELLKHFQTLQLQLFQMLKVAQKLNQKSQLDLMHHYNTQHKIEQLQQVIMKQKY